MLHDNKYWALLSSQLKHTVYHRWVLVLLSSVACPLVEGVLASILTGASPPQYALWLLFGTMCVHAVVVVVVLAGEHTSSLQLTASAVEVTEDCKQCKREQARREEAYRMVRRAFESLNTQTCSMDPQFSVGGHLCEQPLCKAIEPIMTEFIRNIQVVFGVTSAQYSLEVYYAQGILPRRDNIAAVMHPADYELACFCGANVAKEQALELQNNSPVLLGRIWDKPSQKHISYDHTLFYQNNQQLSDVYFHRFATHPIPYACSPEHCGLLVLTSRQDEEFAEDVLDTMGFLASMIANFVYRYSACVYQWKAAHADVATEVCAAPTARGDAAHADARQGENETGRRIDTDSLG